jgi:hypothetical protein
MIEIITLVFAIYAAAFGMVSATTDTLNFVGDYEKVQVKAGMQNWDSKITKTYFGTTHVTTKKIWVDDKGGLHWESRTTVNGVASPIDYNAFPYAYSQQDRSCWVNAQNGEVTSQTCQLRLGYTVIAPAKNWYNQFSDPTKITVTWSGTTLPFGCVVSSTAYNKVEEHTAAKNGLSELPMPRPNTSFNVIPIQPHR